MFLHDARGRYLGPLMEGDGNGGSGGNAGGGDPPSLPPPSPPAANNGGGPSNPPSTPPSPGNGEKPKRKPKQPTSKTKVSASKGGNVRASHTTPGGTTVAATAPTPAAAIDKIADLPVPGGLVMLFAVLLIFLFAIVPVSGGKTRLQLLWDTLRGQTKLPAPKGTPATDVNAAVSAGEAAVSEGIAAALGVPGAQAIATGIQSSVFGPTGGNTGGSGMTLEPGIPESTLAAPTNYNYVDAWNGPDTPQGYYGETVYDGGMFPELE